MPDFAANGNPSARQMCHTVYMNPRKYRWSKVYESAEEELLDFLAARNIVAERHDIEPYEEHPVAASTAVRIWGVEGTASFTVDGKRFSIQPGDVLELPTGVSCVVSTSLSPFAWYQSQ